MTDRQTDRQTDSQTDTDRISISQSRIFIALALKINRVHCSCVCTNVCVVVLVLQDRQRVYMVLEYADGGDALKHIQATGAISEERARLWTSQIASAVRYMHDLDIAHRDLKLENLLIDACDSIKICDFGFVREATPGDLSRTYCGSKSYAAPEILQARCFTDLYSIATCILLVCVCIFVFL